MKQTIFIIILCCTSAFSAPTKIPTVFVEKIEATELYNEVTYPARVVSLVNATVLSETTGVVKRIRAPLGTRVKRGQEILRVHHTDPIYRYAPVVVRAPVQGVVSQIEVSVGSHVSTGTKLATITNPKKLQLIIEVATADLGIIRNNLIGIFKPAGSRKNTQAKVKGVSAFVDPATGTATAELSVSTNENIVLRPGQVGTVSFKTGQHKGFQVTQDAVVYRGKKTFLRVIEDDKARLTPVRLGRTQRGQVEILEGLTDGNTVVVRASQYIKNGEKVKVEVLEN